MASSRRGGGDGTATRRHGEQSGDDDLHDAYMPIHLHDAYTDEDVIFLLMRDFIVMHAPTQFITDSRTLRFLVDIMCIKRHEYVAVCGFHPFHNDDEIR